MHHVRIIPALTITGRHDHTDGTSNVSVHPSMPQDEEALNRQRVPQRSVETTLEDGAVVLEDTGFPIAFTVTAERYTLSRRRKSEAPPIFAGRSRPFSRAAGRGGAASSPPSLVCHPPSAKRRDPALLPLLRMPQRGDARSRRRQADKPSGQDATRCLRCESGEC